MNRIGKVFLCLMLAACGGSKSSQHTATPAPMTRTTSSTASNTAPTSTRDTSSSTTGSSTLPSSGSSTYASGGGMGSGMGAASGSGSSAGMGAGMGSGSGSASGMGATSGMGSGSGSGSGDADNDADDTGTAMGAGSGSASGTSGATDMSGSKIAKAEMTSIKDGSSIGTLTFELGTDGQVTVTGDFTGLAKGDHAIYIHEKGDCSNKAKNVGGHLNPTHQKHGAVSAAKRHEGDFGNVTADKDGNATFSMTTDSVSMEPDRPDSILNRAVVIHVKKDSKSGNAGAPLACGVITMQ
jgi:Cu-Zn family superoxide dismutase